jgi:outer membrane protein insertion porin family
MTFSARLLAIGCLLLVTADWTWAQLPSIAEIRIEQEGRVISDPSLFALLETKVGQPLSMRRVRESETHLASLSRFDDIAVFRDDIPDGIRLTYRLVPTHPVDRLEFRGTLGIGEGTLREVVRERFGNAPSATRRSQVVELLRQEYKNRGYAAANVDTELVPRHEPHRSTLVIMVDAGPRSVIKRIDYSEDEAERGTLVGRPDIRAGEPYDLQRINRALERYVNTMRGNRFYEATAEPGPVQFDADGVVVTVALRRGPRVQVIFMGDRLSKSEQDRLVPVRAEASVAEDLLENWQIAIENYLRNRGYKDAAAPFTRNQKDGELTIVFNVTRGPQYTIGKVDLTGGGSLTKTEIRDALRIKEGDPFVEAQLDAVRDVMTRIYRSGGFIKATVAATSSILPSEQPSDPTRRVQVAITINEGSRTFIRSLTFSGNTVATDDQLRALTSVTEGQPLSEVEITRTRAAITRYYQDRGFENIDVQVVFAQADQQVDVGFAVNEGTQVLVDQIIVDGNERISRGTIERELTVKPGQPLGYTALVESRARLRATGLFRQASIDERRHVGEARRDLLVRVQETAPTTIGFGGGLEIGSRLRSTGPDSVPQEQTDFVPRGFFEIGRRNMWGKNRSVNLFTRVSGRSRDEFSETGHVNSSYGVNEYRVYASYREPKLFGTPGVVALTGIAERAIRTSFSFVTREMREELVVQPSRIYTAILRHSIERTELFDVDPELEQPLIDRVFPQVRLSKISGTLIRNTRDDQLDPSRGVFLSAEGWVAARGIGSEVGFVKTFLQGSWYRQLPSMRRMVFAVRGVLGAAHGFPREIAVNDESGAPVLLPDGSPLIATVQDLPASERFFAGGSTTNRGFSIDRLGTPETISGGFPTGGNGEILFNSELRVSLLRSLAGVVFVDAGNVFKDASDLSLAELRPAAGFGFHVRSPIGPVRAELGFNLDPRELRPGQFERSYILHVSIGPAF